MNDRTNNLHGEHQARSVSRRDILYAGAAVAAAAPLLATGSRALARSTATSAPLAGKSPLTTLNNGVSMPVFGVGTFSLPTIQTADVVSVALTHGYRLIDTAKNYGNEKEAGEGIVRSGVPRSEIFITTKLWIEDFGYDEALRAFDLSAKQLGVDQVDLYLLHWPVPSDFEKTIAAYTAVEKLYADKRIRAIGVSNFTPAHLQRLMDRTDVVPAVNQIELHPYLTQAAARAAHERYNIKTESWSPIGGGFRNLPADPTNVVHLLEDDVLVGLARKHRKSVVQIILRWHNQHGFIAIPKSQHYERLLSNIDIFDFELTADDMAAIDALNRNLRSGPDPDRFDVPAFREIVERRRAGG